MPLYEYTCNSCNYQFEQLVSSSERLDQKCAKCGSNARTNMSSFSSVVSGSTKKTVDVVIGEEANKRWQTHYDRRDKRRQENAFKDITTLKDSPVMSLGDRKEKDKRKEYSSALQKHREGRRTRGQAQFTGSGSF